MKNSIFILMLSILMASCSNNRYTINGTITDKKVNGKMIYITDLNTNQKIDSTIVEDGVFTFENTFESATILMVNIPRTPYYANVLSENADIKVKFTDRPDVTSNGLNGALNKIHELEFKTMEFAQNFSKNHTEEEVYSIVPNILFDQKIDPSVPLSPEDSLMINEYLQYVIASDKMRQTILESNKDNILGVYCISWIFDLYEQNPNGISLDMAESLLDQVPLAREYKPVMKSYNILKATDATSEGNMFVDFSGKNVDGTPAKLSDYVGKGKYALVDFWASWCAPCTKEIPNLKYIYKNYPELVILGVNVWDNNDNFQKYIENKKIKWSMLYASDDKIATELYGITSIPSIILFDPQGIIVDKTLHGEKMKRKIAEIFKK